jgi:UDP-glucose 4-epimerase
MKLLVTGGTGKVGQHVLAALAKHPRMHTIEIVALCHSRTVDQTDRVRVLQGSIADRDAVEVALEGVTHVLHLAAVKESPDLAIDVAVKGMFVMLEAFRSSPTAERFILLGGDCSVGHMFQDYAAPITETDSRRAYPGCYALTKVIEEVMLEQYIHQYDIDGCILRAPWIMEKDDLRYAMSFGEDQFGGPAWDMLMDADTLAQARKTASAPLMLDVTGAPLKRNLVHVDDVVSALLLAVEHPRAAQQTFNIAMSDPLDYGVLAQILKDRHGLSPIEIPTPFHSNWLDNTKARHLLGWAPSVDLEALVERAWTYKRTDNEVRNIWYPG